MVFGWLRKVAGGRREPDVIPDLNLLEADAYLGLRSSTRHPVQIGVDQCFVIPPAGEPAAKERWLPVTIVDVSEGGARLVCTEAVQSGLVLRLSFHLPKGGGEWHGTGRITWVSQTGLLAGLAFNPPTPGDRGQLAAYERLKRYVVKSKEGAPA